MLIRHSLAIALLPAVLPPSLTWADPSQAVREDYATFRAAVLSKDGPAASRLVSREMLNTYDRARRLALDSAGTDFDDLGQTDVLLVFQARKLLSTEALENLAREEGGLFAWGVRNGLVRRDMVEAFALDAVQVEGERAVASLTKGGQPVTDAVFEFVREDGRWKFDMRKLMKQVEGQLDAVRKQAGKSKIELALFLLERTYGEPLPPQILNGPLRKTGTTTAPAATTRSR